MFTELFKITASSADTLAKMCTNLKGVGARSGARRRALWATLVDYPYQIRGDFKELCEHFTKRAVSSKNSMNNFTLP